VVAKDAADGIEAALREAGEAPVRIGEVVATPHGQPQVVYSGRLDL
jgi:hypothetical protein